MVTMPRGLHCSVLRTLQLYVGYSLSLRRETYFYLANYDYIRSFPSPFTANVILKRSFAVLLQLMRPDARRRSVLPQRHEAIKRTT
jgi:hypothetical protein